MELFQDIPQVIQVDILCHWLKQEEVALLDSALCCKSNRPRFLSALGSKCVYPSLDTSYEEQAQWVTLRNIRIRDLTLRHNTNAATREKLLKSVSPSLKELCLCMADFDDEDEFEITSFSIDDTLFDIAMLCPNIQELTTCNVKVTSNFNLVILKCATLKTIRLYRCTDITSSTIKSICSAPNMRALDFDESQFDSDTPDFSTYKSDSIRELYISNTKLSRAGVINLCSCFPFLTMMSVGPVRGDTLPDIASLCPHIKGSRFNITDMLTEQHATLLCKHWPHIQLLQITSEFENSVACSEEVVLILLKGCSELLKLSVCNLDCPFGKDHLYYSSAHPVAPDAHSIPSAITPATAFAATTSKAAKSKVTDLFLESATAATLSVILTLCPQLNTLAIRHCTPVKPPRTVLTDQQRAAEYALSSLNHPTCSVRKLHLHNIRSLAGVDLLSLTGLEELQLSNIGRKLSNEGLLQVVKNNPNLRNISLYNCQQLRGYSLILSLLKLCPALHTFNFTECDALRTEDKSRSFSTAIAVIEDMIRDGYPNIKKVNIKL